MTSYVPHASSFRCLPETAPDMVEQASSKPILQWAEKRAEAMRRAQYLRGEHVDPPPLTASRPPPIAWRTPPPPRMMAVSHNMSGSHSTSTLLELSFRGTRSPAPQRMSPAVGYTKQFESADGVSEKQLHGELVKTGRILTGAQKQLAEAREMATTKVMEAREEAAQAIKYARDRDAHTAAVEAELEHLLQQKEMAVASERAKLANTLAEQRQALQDEMAAVKAESEQRLERQRLEQQAMEQEHRRLTNEVASLRQQLQGNTHSAEHEADLERKLAEQAEAERQERVEHLRRQAVRKVFKQGLSKGFNAWFAMFTDRKHKKQLLNHAAGRLCRPKLASGFHEWKAMCAENSQASVREKEKEELKAEVRKRKALEKEVESLKAEFQAELQAELYKAVSAAEAERKEQERKWTEEAARLELEKAKAVRDAKHTLIHEQALRRISQQGIAKGFAAWKDTFLERQRQRQLVQRASARLSKPALAGAFYEWLAVHQDVLDAQKEDEKEKLKEELEAFRAKALEEEAAAAKRLADQAAANRDERIEQLHRMAGRRLGKQGLARGFNAWQELYLERKRKAQLLQRASARLSKPRLAGAFYEWLAVREEALRAQEERERQALADQLQLAQSEAARREEDTQRQLAEQAAAVREERIEQLHRMAGRRMGKQGLTRGFNAWQELYLERKRKTQLLQRSSAMLSKPKLAGAFIEWWTVREEAIREAEHEAQEALLASEAQNSSKLQKDLQRAKDKADSQIERIRGEYEEVLKAERAAAAKELAKVQAQLEKYTKSQTAEFEKNLADQAAELREQRVEQLHRMAMRRISKQGISRGFNRWLEGYLAKRRSLQLLNRAGARLTKPKLADAFIEWWTVHQEELDDRERRETEQIHAQETEMRDSRNQQLEAERAILEQHLERARIEFEETRKKDRLAAEKELEIERKKAAEAIAQEQAAATQTIAELKKKVELYSVGRDEDIANHLDKQAAADREDRVEQLHRMAGRRLGKQGLARGFNAWQTLWEARRRNLHLMQRASARLSKPKLASAFIEWWTVREETLQAAERASTGSRILSMQEEVGRVRAELREQMKQEQVAAREELKRVKAEYEEKLDKEAKRSDDMEEQLKSVVSNGQQALIEARTKIESVNSLEDELRQAKNDAQAFAHDMKLQEAALKDERKAGAKLQRELERMREASGNTKEAEAKAKEASTMAAKSTKEATDLLTRLAKQEEELKKGSEQRLAALLAEQRMGFEQTLKIQRLESDHKVRAPTPHLACPVPQAPIHTLIVPMLVPWQTKTLTTKVQELERALASTKAALSVSAAQAKDPAAGPQKSSMLGTLTALKFAANSSALQDNARELRRRMPKTVPRGPVSHTDMRLAARAAKEAAEEELRAQLKAEQGGDTPSHGSPSQSERGSPSLRPPSPEASRPGPVRTGSP